MEGKKTVVIYTDWGTVFDKLEEDEAGRLIKHFFNYVRDMNPEAPDRITELLFEPMKSTLKRDLKKWEVVLDMKAEAGHRGGIKSGETRRKKAEERKQKEADASSASKNEASASKTQANEAVIGTVSVIGTVNEIHKHPPPEFTKAWMDFVEMRKKMKKGFTARAEELAKNTLRKLSGKDVDLAIKIINQTIEHGWLTFYEIKPNGIFQKQEPGTVISKPNYG